MSTLCLIRHGEKLSELGDPGLTENGFRQAHETGLYLKQFPITQIISSPYLRTRQTAQCVSDVLQMPFTVHDALVERMNWDDPDVPFQEFLQEWVTATANRDYVPKFGSSSRATGERVQSLVKDKAGENDHLVLVTHGGAIIDYLRTVFGDEAVANLRIRYEEGDDYGMMHCAINKVVLGDTPKLELLNFVEHLSKITE